MFPAETTQNPSAPTPPYFPLGLPLHCLIMSFWFHFVISLLGPQPCAQGRLLAWPLQPQQAEGVLFSPQGHGGIGCRAPELIGASERLRCAFLLLVWLGFASIVVI